MNNDDLINKISVLVQSCDFYDEAWEPFFCLFREHWKCCPYKVYLSTESLKYDKYDVITINTGEGAWSERLNNALKQIETEFVFLFLEDFFFQKAVNISEIERTVNYMLKNNDLACVYYNRVTGYSSPSELEHYTEMMPQETSRYMLNCQAALWRKSVLESATSFNMSPWEFEEHGYEKLPENVKKMRFLCKSDSRYNQIRDGDVFPVLLTRSTGYGIWKSMWLWNNEKLFKKYGIKLKYKKLKKYPKWKFIIKEKIERIKVKIFKKQGENF